MSLFNQEVNYFGLDIGSTAIRLVQLRKGGSKPVLITYGSVDVPAGLTISDSSMDQDKVAVIIRQLVNDTKVSTKNVVVGLASSSIFASVITTPKLTAGELAKAIKFQADQYIPMALDQVKLDWAVIGPGPTEHDQEVLLVAAPNGVTNKYMGIIEKAGLEILALETNATASTRALAPSNTAVMVLDVGSLSSELTIALNGTPYLIRSIGVGGGTFIRAVAQNLNLDDAQAEQFTQKFGLTQTKLEGQVLKAIKPTLAALVTEIQKSSKFFLGRYQNIKLEKLILTGGVAKLPELSTHLANATGLPVEMGNAWTNIAYPAGMQDKLIAVSNQFSVAAGLAERAFI